MCDVLLHKVQSVLAAACGPANLSPLAVHFGTCRSGLLSRRSTQRSVSAAFSRHLACCSCEQLLRCLRRRRAAPSSIHCPCARTLSALAVGRHGSLPALPPDSKPALVKPALGSAHACASTREGRNCRAQVRDRQVETQRGREFIVQLRACRHGLAWHVGQSIR